MKTRTSKQIRLLAGPCLALLAACPWAAAQVQAELDIQTYAGVTIVGEIGKVYSIEYETNLTEPSESDWRCLEFLQLPASPYLWVDKSAPATGKRIFRARVFESPTNMVFIPPGTFRMGSPQDEIGHRESEGPQTAVTISQGFWMGKYTVTQGDYLAVMGNNPSYSTDDADRPVDTVSWNDAVTYCATLTDQSRLTGEIPLGTAYRLATEAEWEYACRAWTSTRFSHGDDPGNTKLSDYAWYGDPSIFEGETHPVGQKLPNPWGLYDMHGNVLEWCQDWSARYDGGIALDPQGPTTGSARVARGGYWADAAEGCRSADRAAFFPDYVDRNIGFRIVLASGQP
jgi:formylglycine-generating enzyme required for sulfatase activity